MVRNFPAILAYNMSIDYLRGNGVRKNLWMSFKLNRFSARLGFLDAQLAQGWFFHNGFGVRRDLQKARHWYLKAARRGEKRASFNLGQLAFDRGDFALASRWFRKAVRQGHTRSLYYLGRLHLFGLGVEQDTRKGAQFLRRAAREGIIPAKRLVASARFRSLTRRTATKRRVRK